MNFSRIARQLQENTPAAIESAEEKATTGGDKQIQNTNRRKKSQDNQMLTL